MKYSSNKSRPLTEIVDSVTIPIFDVDKAKEDHKNTIGVIVQINGDGFHETGTTPDQRTFTRF